MLCNHFILLLSMWTLMSDVWVAVCQLISKWTYDNMYVHLFVTKTDNKKSEERVRKNKNQIQNYVITFRCRISTSHCIGPLGTCTESTWSHSGGAGWSWHRQCGWAWCCWNLWKTFMRLWNTTRRDYLMEMDVYWHWHWLHDTRLDNHKLLLINDKENTSTDWLKK